MKFRLSEKYRGVAPVAGVFSGPPTWNPNVCFVVQVFILFCVIHGMVVSPVIGYFCSKQPPGGIMLSKQPQQLQPRQVQRARLWPSLVLLLTSSLRKDYHQS